MKNFCYVLYVVIGFSLFSGCKSSKITKGSSPSILGDKPSSAITTQTNGIQLSDKKEATQNATSPLKSRDFHVSADEKTNAIINAALKFEGVRYKYGGTTKKGMDCSGLVYTAFKTEAIDLPRISRDMAKHGEPVAIENIRKGDLLFFSTSKKRDVINHVGLVVTASVGRVEFIHSTTSQGVITSSLAEHYWYYSFVDARRIL